MDFDYNINNKPIKIPKVKNGNNNAPIKYNCFI